MCNFIVITTINLKHSQNEKNAFDDFNTIVNSGSHSRIRDNMLWYPLIICKNGLS